MLDHMVATFCEMSFKGLFTSPSDDPVLSLMGLANMFPTLPDNIFPWAWRESLQYMAIVGSSNVQWKKVIISHDFFSLQSQWISELRLDNFVSRTLPGKGISSFKCDQLHAIQVFYAYIYHFQIVTARNFHGPIVALFLRIRFKLHIMFTIRCTNTRGPCKFLILCPFPSNFETTGLGPMTSCSTQCESNFETFSQTVRLKSRILTDHRSENYLVSSNCYS